MGEWIPTTDGIPLKTTDAMLEYILPILDENKALKLELATYRTIVPTGSDTPANVPTGRTHRRAHASPS